VRCPAAIKENGPIQPIAMRRLPAATAEGVRYEIVAGEHRSQAAKMTDIPTIDRELTDKEATAVALIVIGAVTTITLVAADGRPIGFGNTGGVDFESMHELIANQL
jgi:hypothetical protein